MVIVIDNASLLIATTYKMGIKGLLYAYWSIITITFFILKKKLHGKDLEYASRSQFRPGMGLKSMIEV